eukprot:TRINITY_DN24762_c0_g1_i1.p1 TRINITY_DN24762_c0_g1~~TRINITY_DN24762_c0_g1_i1.p1  ORF type:complete len:278 (+),score=79.55 TRINITY_DN24762_c0_g1_i1:33-866(+)
MGCCGSSEPRDNKSLPRPVKEKRQNVLVPVLVGKLPPEPIDAKDGSEKVNLQNSGRSTRVKDTPEHRVFTDTGSGTGGGTRSLVLEESRKEFSIKHVNPLEGPEDINDDEELKIPESEGKIDQEVSDGREEIEEEEVEVEEECRDEESEQKEDEDEEVPEEEVKKEEVKEELPLPRMTSSERRNLFFGEIRSLESEEERNQAELDPKQPLLHDSKTLGFRATKPVPKRSRKRPTMLWIMEDMGIPVAPDMKERLEAVEAIEAAKPKQPKKKKKQVSV